MIAAGGTGGHVYPAIAVSEALKRDFPDSHLTFVGTTDGFERPIVERNRELFEHVDEVRAGPLHGVNPLRLITSVFKLGIGIIQAMRLLRRRKTQIVFSTGGWVSFPMAFSARLYRIPMVIYLPDIEPGMTIKVLRQFATKVAVTVADSESYFKPGQSVVTGYPLRSELRTATRDAGITHFGLDPRCKTVLVFGGSRGARAVNKALEGILNDLLDDGIQIIHVTGTLDWERSQREIGTLREHAHYHAYSYLHDDMGLAFAAADLAVCRAGASILGEFPYFHLPSILIPLAYSWRYQQVNAEYMAAHGAAIHLPEERAESDLLRIIRQLFVDDGQLKQMDKAVAALGQADGAANVASLLAQLTREET